MHFASFLEPDRSHGVFFFFFIFGHKPFADWFPANFHTPFPLPSLFSIDSFHPPSSFNFHCHQRSFVFFRCHGRPSLCPKGGVVILLNYPFPPILSPFVHPYLERNKVWAQAKEGLSGCFFFLLLTFLSGWSVPSQVLPCPRWSRSPQSPDFPLGPVDPHDR